MHHLRRLSIADITVILPTKNETKNIRQFLAAVPDEVAMVVVDASTDDTAAVTQRVRPNNTTVVASVSNIPVARQLGSVEAQTPWLLFTDADVSFADDYFERLEAIELGPNDAGIVGTKSTVKEYDTYYRWFCRGQRALDLLGIPAATGSNMLVRADALREIGGFDSELSVNEDTELMFRVKKSNYAVRFEPSLVVKSFDQRRLEAGLARKIVHGAVRNSALYLGIFNKQLRKSDWGYWPTEVEPRRSKIRG